MVTKSHGLNFYRFELVCPLKSMQTLSAEVGLAPSVSLVGKERVEKTQHWMRGAESIVVEQDLPAVSLGALANGTATTVLGETFTAGSVTPLPFTWSVQPAYVSITLVFLRHKFSFLN